MTASNYLEEKILNKVLRNTDFTISAVYAKLHTGDPGEDCTANAATETTRQAATFGAASNPAGTATLSNTPTWTNVAASETYSHISFWDASTAGNPIGSGAMNTPVPVVAGQIFQLSTFVWTAA